MHVSRLQAQALALLRGHLLDEESDLAVKPADA